MKPIHILFILLAALLLAGLVWLLPALLPHQFGGTVIDAPQPAYDFSLPSTQGRPLALSELRGKVVLLFFGYTTCPDVCPATLANLNLALQSLGESANRVQVVMVTVDPERDTPERLQAYLDHFDPQHMLGLSGDLATTSQIAGKYGIYFQKRLTDSGGYLVDHTAYVQLIDAAGLRREVFSFGTPPAAIAADVGYWIKAR
jgi:protein SCO1/2